MERDDLDGGRRSALTAPGDGAGGTGGIFAGVDGGGTRTRVLLTDGEGVELYRAEGGAGLVDPRSPSRTSAALADLLRWAAREAAVPLPCEGLCAGLAGAGDPAIGQAVHAALQRQRLALKVMVVSDGEIALRGAFGTEPGILLMAGTGSAAFGRGPDERTGRCGGWGRLLGDGGSGYAIGLAALRTAVETVDGMEGGSERLLERVLREIEVKDPGRLPTWVERASKLDVAALAPLVIAQAEDGDGAAAHILEQATDTLARYAESLAKRLGPWPKAVPVASIGGLTGSSFFLSRLHDRVLRVLPDARFQEARSDPVTAAASLARSVGSSTCAPS